MKRISTGLKIWELTLLCALSVTLCAALWAQGETERIDDALIRLHVLAVSDDAEEQAVKLRVRDAVLAFLRPRLAGAESREEAEQLLLSAIDELQSAAEQAAERRQVTVTLTRERYPTRRYEGFALPAGRYTSLRVILGEGAGRNWWCVVYPPLWLDASGAEALIDALGEDTASILCADGHTVVRFKLLELWGKLRG